MWIQLEKRIYKQLQRLLVLGLIGLLLSVQSIHAREITLSELEPTTTTTPAWLEPRGLNVMEFVGRVPEAHLIDSIVSYDVGILQYISGSRTGNTVKMQVRVYPYYAPDNRSLVFTCPAQLATFDQWPSPTSALTAKIYTNGQDITSDVFQIEYWPTGQTLPVRPVYGSPHYRYNKQQMQAQFQNGALQIPANAGCNIFMSGSPDNITAEFTIQAPSPIAIEHLGSQAFTFGTYVGPGAAGHLDPLRSQMEQRFPGIRHDKFPLSIPSGTDYALVTFPPTGVNPGGDTDRNRRQPAGGTYRLGRATNNVLSVDHRNTMGLPIYGQWQDADQAPGAEYLPFFSDPAILASPEYFVPAGMSYDPCMSNGNCPAALLDAIYNATMPMSIHYYRITRTEAGLNRIPLQQVGSGWSPGRSADLHIGDNEVAPAQISNGSKLYLPLIQAIIPKAIESDDPTGCPCGWFDSLGRMFDYIPPQ
jgi:hypothetical protein